MKEIVYSPDAIEKIITIEKTVSAEYGDAKGQEVKGEIVKAIRRLADQKELGVAISEIYGIDSNYRKLFVCHNHVFYYIDGDSIRIVDIFNERENFIARLFSKEQLF